MSRSYLCLKYLAALSAIAAVAIVIHAQQTGPGGVPGGAGGGAYVTAANTFSANQTIASGYGLQLNGYKDFLLYGQSNYQDNLYFQETGGGVVEFSIYGGSGNTQGVGIPHQSCYQWIGNPYIPAAAGDSFLCAAANIYTFGSAYDTTDGWVQLSAIGNGASGNTDLRGHVALVSGSGTYTFTKAYTVAPTCVATDTTTAAAVKVAASTTTLTLTGTGTDTLNYICAD